MAKPRVGVQLIVFGEAARKDLPGTLKAAKAGGYDGFEGGAASSKEQAEKIRAAMEAAGIACCGCHAGFSDWDNAKVVAERIAGTKAVGAKYLITSGRSDWETMDEYLEAAKALNQAGKQCRDEGITFCYHNHHWEFRKIGGQTPLHVMIAATDPEAVKLCPDVYWVHVGGEAPAEFIACYQDRIPYYHFKDGLGGEQFAEFRELGQGKVDLPAALKAALATNPEWVTVEQDRSNLDPAESVRVSREYLKSIGL
jgi:sugar phosphate isomerase/epimerase